MERYVAKTGGDVIPIIVVSAARTVPKHNALRRRTERCRTLDARHTTTGNFRSLGTSARELLAQAAR